MLEQLRRKLHVVAGDGRSRQGRIGDARIQTVKSVSKLVKHSEGIVPRDQHGLSGLALNEV
jgi:hypothetical protein